METKPLLYGLIGFFAGGLLVAIAATSFNRPVIDNTDQAKSTSTMSVDDMTSDLENKSGDDFDKAFIANMIAHHQGAIDMAKRAEQDAKHTEIKEMSKAIASAQEKEIATMKQWQFDWGYVAMPANHDVMNHSSHD